MLIEDNREEKYFIDWVKSVGFGYLCAAKPEK